MQTLLEKTMPLLLRLMCRGLYTQRELFDMQTEARKLSLEWQALGANHIDRLKTQLEQALNERDFYKAESERLNVKANGLKVRLTLIQSMAKRGIECV